MLKLLLALSLMVAAMQVSAISNIESERPGFPEEGWSGQVEFGIDGETGNSREENYIAAAKIVNRRDNNIYLGIIEREYGKTRDIKDTDESFLHGRWIHVLDKKWAYEAFAQFEENEFDNLTSRALAGGGMRYIVAENDDVFSLSVGGGGFREREVLDLGTYEEKTWRWRINSFAVYKHRINDQIHFSATAYYQPNISNFSDYRTFLTAAMSVKLTDALDLKMQYELSHDSEPAKNLNATPPINKHETNAKYQTSLVYRF